MKKAPPLSDAQSVFLKLDLLSGDDIHHRGALPEGRFHLRPFLCRGSVVPAVASVMDMYYPIDIDLTKAENNSLSVTVKNVGSDVISVTNLKITGNAALVPASAPDNEQESLNAARTLFAPVTMKTVRMAVNKGIDPEEDTAKPEDPAVTEEPEETEKPDDGSLVIDEPEETAAPTPAPSVTPDKPAETGNTIQKVVQSITRSISSFFKSIFRR